MMSYQVPPIGLMPPPRKRLAAYPALFPLKNPAQCASAARMASLRISSVSFSRIPVNSGLAFTV